MPGHHVSNRRRGEAELIMECNLDQEVINAPLEDIREYLDWQFMITVQNNGLPPPDEDARLRMVLSGPSIRALL